VHVRPGIDQDTDECRVPDGQLQRDHPAGGVPAHDHGPRPVLREVAGYLLGDGRDVPQATQYGRAEMSAWYREHDLLPDGIEQIIPADSPLHATAERIMNDTALAQENRTVSEV
jgi:hypothetical protein